ncbi:MAG: TetR/AcrR family transcriptional regulator [Burkholderiales bacterium]
MTHSRRDRERAAREADIIAAAENLFYTKGFENTSMDEIAKYAEFTKKTIYQYFKSKEDLFYAVASKNVNVLLGRIREYSKKGKTGIEKLKNIKAAAYEYARDNRDAYRLLSYAQYVHCTVQDSPYYRDIMASNTELFAEFGRIIEEGKADGSISSRISHPLGTIALFFIVTGFIGRINEAGEAYSAIYGVNIDDLAHLCFELTDRLLLPEN